MLVECCHPKMAEVGGGLGAVGWHPFRVQEVREDGSVDEVPGLGFRSGPCPVPPGKLDAALDRRQLQRRGKVGRAECQLVLAQHEAAMAVEGARVAPLGVASLPFERR